MSILGGNVFGTAGFGTDATWTPRIVLDQQAGRMYLETGGIISGGKSRDPLNSGDESVLRNGLLMGLRSSDALWAPSILGVTTVAYAHSATVNTVLTVGAATATEIVRRIGSTGTFKLTGPPTAAGTVATQTITFSAVNTSTGQITITAGSADAVSGSYIRPTDGSETILGVLDEEVKVTDQNAANQNARMTRLLLGGVVRSENLLNWPVDSSLKAWVKAQLRAVGYAWAFTDDFGI